MKEIDYESLDKMSVVCEEPPIAEFNAELIRSSTGIGVTQILDSIENTRFCKWPGQSADGKKYDKLTTGGKAFPWDGASDTKVPLADEVINSLVDLLVTSFWRASMRIMPNKLDVSSDSAASNALSDWVIRNKLYNDLVREVELLAQYVETYGWAGVHVTWDQQIGQKKIQMTMQQVMEASGQAQPGSIMAELPDLISKPEAADQVAELFLQVFPHLNKAKALKAIGEMRKTGSCSFPIPKLVRNQPCVSTLSPYDELVFPRETTDIQSSRVVFRRSYMTVAEIRGNVLTDKWDEEWANEAVKSMGKFTSAVDLSVSLNQTDDYANLVEVVHAYQKAIDEDGTPGIWCTVYCPAVSDKWAKFELLDYEHGQYPFVIWRSEIIHRKAQESRGVPEICATWQNEAKAQRDSIFDYTSISTIPPIEVPKTRAGQLKIGPAVQVAVLRRGEIGFMTMPEREPTVAFKLIEAIEAQTDRYFGRPTEKTPPLISQLRQQRIINSWLHGWTDVFKQVSSLSAQYLDAETVMRITGINTQITQDDLDFDITLRFDVRELNSDLVTEKIAALREIAASDPSGTISVPRLIPALVRLVDPTIAQEVIVTKNEADQRMFDETQQDIALMALGNPAKLRENDPAAGARLQLAQGIIASNPRYQQAMIGDENFKKNIETYAKNLMFSVTQQQNAQIGRVGVAPDQNQSPLVQAS